MRITTALAVAVSGLLAVASAAPVVDQNAILAGGAETSMDDTFTLQQSFTPGVSGTLTTIELGIHRVGTTPLPFTVIIDLRGMSEGTPSGAQIGSGVQVSWDDVGSGLTDTLILDVSEENMEVTAGVPVAISVYSGNSAAAPSEFVWRGAPADVYAGGQAFEGVYDEFEGEWNYTGYDADRAFRTFVEPLPMDLPTMANLLDELASEEDGSIAKKLAKAAKLVEAASEELEGESARRSKAVKVLAKAHASVSAAVKKGLSVETVSSILEDMEKQAVRIVEVGLQNHSDGLTEGQAEEFFGMIEEGSAAETAKARFKALAKVMKAIEKAYNP